MDILNKVCMYSYYTARFDSCQCAGIYKVISLCIFIERYINNLLCRSRCCSLCRCSCLCINYICTSRICCCSRCLCCRNCFIKLISCCRIELKRKCCASCLSACFCNRPIACSVDQHDIRNYVLTFDNNAACCGTEANINIGSVFDCYCSEVYLITAFFCIINCLAGF